MNDLSSAMALVRALHLAAMLSLLGSAGFLAWILPAAGAPPEALRRRLARLPWISGLISLAAWVVWFVLQSAVIAGAEDVPDLLDALPVVAMHTRFGNILLVRLGLLLPATALAFLRVRQRSPVYVIVVLTAVALGLQGFIGHAGATEGAVGDGLVASEALHLVAAGLWLGALLPLVISLFALPPRQAALACERFTPIGLGCVLVLAGTGLAQGLEFIGSLAALVGTRYGHFALLKIGLFVIALMLAALNRLWLADRLAAGVASARRHLLLSVCFETLAGLAIVNAAAFMASSPPAAHIRAVSPFSRQFSPGTVNKAPEVLRKPDQTTSGGDQEHER